MAGTLLNLVKDRAIATAENGGDDEQHSLDLKEHVDLSFGLKGEMTALGDAAGEAIGIGPISAIDLNASSARMSALQAQKQLAMETINIVNTAPQLLFNLFT